jgi:hypothetical protein
MYNYFIDRVRLLIICSYKLNTAWALKAFRKMVYGATNLHKAKEHQGDKQQYK